MNLKLTFLFALMIVFFGIVFSADFSGTLLTRGGRFPLWKP